MNGYHGLDLIYCLTNSWSLIKSAIHLYSTLCQEWVMTVHFTSKFPREKVNCSICQIPGDSKLKLRNIINATRLPIEQSLLGACSIGPLWQTWYMIHSITFRIEDADVIAYDISDDSQIARDIVSCTIHGRHEIQILLLVLRVEPYMFHSLFVF